MSDDLKRISEHHDKIRQAKPGAVLEVTQRFEIPAYPDVPIILTSSSPTKGETIKINPGECLKVAGHVNQADEYGLGCQIVRGGRLETLTLWSENFHCVDIVEEV